MMSEQKQRSRDAFKPRSSFSCNSKYHIHVSEGFKIVDDASSVCCFRLSLCCYHQSSCELLQGPLGRRNEALKHTTPSRLDPVNASFRSAFVLCSRSCLLTVMACDDHVSSQPWINHHRRLIRNALIRSPVGKADQAFPKHNVTLENMLKCRTVPAS